jgi:hypothetical protein
MEVRSWVCSTSLKPGSSCLVAMHSSTLVPTMVQKTPDSGVDDRWGYNLLGWK